MRALVLLPLLLLGACAGSPTPHTGPYLAYSHRYPGLSCAPFARAEVGLALDGDAADWWGEAARRYPRSDSPRLGSVLVFRRSSRLPYGHVSVVSRLLDSRRILVIQANWVPGELDEDQLVVDVSPRNDWTEVRVWYPPTGRMGTHAYRTYGFIVGPAGFTHEALVGRARTAALMVTGG